MPEPALLGLPAGPGYWLVLRHTDVRAVLRDPRRFSSRLGGTQVRDPATPADLAYVRLMMLDMDPPEHSRLRRVIGFQDPDYAASARYAGGTPMAAAALRERPDPGPDGRMPDPRTRAGIPDLYAYAHLLAEHKRRRPGDDVMSVLLSEVDEDGGRVRRTATEDVTLAGVEIAAGDKVVVSFAAANRDETVFADPGRFDVTRPPGEHLVFGYGPHFCLGAHLARAQLRALFGELLRRTGWIEPAGNPVLLRSSFQRGVKHLPVTTDRPAPASFP